MDDCCHQKRHVAEKVTKRTLSARSGVVMVLLLSTMFGSLIQTIHRGTSSTTASAWQRYGVSSSFVAAYISPVSHGRWKHTSHSIRQQRSSRLSSTTQEDTDESVTTTDQTATAAVATTVTASAVTPVDFQFDMDDVISLCKRRGLVYPSSEIYNGFAGFFDYGPVGVELKRSVKDFWWKTFVTSREDVVGLDSSIIHNPTTWKSSGTCHISVCYVFVAVCT